MQLSNSLTPRSIASSNYLLRKYGGAAAAYSLQRLDTSVENVVRARRSTDDTEADFTAQEVSGGSLREFALNNDSDLVRFADQASATDKRMYFDGVNDYVNLTGQYGSAGRIELKVVLPSAQSQFTKLLGNRTTAGVDGVFLQVDDVAGLIIKAYVNDSSAVQTPALSVGQEHEIALAWGSGSVELFLDGVSAGTDTYTGAITPKNLLLGYFAGPYFKGLIYDVRHYSDAAGTTLVNSYNGYGNTDADWEDQVGSDDGIVVGSPALFSRQGFDAYVTTLYDQSGNGRDATQATAASQPQIVADGVVVTDSNGNAATLFDGSDDYLGISGLSISDSTSSIVVDYKTLVGNESPLQIGTANEVSSIIRDAGSLKGRRITTDADAGAVLSSNTVYLITHLATDDRGEVWQDGSSVATNETDVTLPTGTVATLGALSSLATYRLGGNLTEVVIYDSDQSANRAAIESNIASRYGIVI